MLKFDQFLDESYLDSNHAPLYHKTDTFALESIIDSDTLNMGIYDNPYGNKEIKMISLTRNKKLDMSNYRMTLNTIISLDKNLLKNSYEIIPYDFFIHSHKEIFPKWDINRKENFEYEEIVLVNITDLHKYLLEIEIIGDFVQINTIYNKLQDYKNKFNIKIKINNELL